MPNARTDGRANGRTSGRTHGRAGGRADERASGPTDERTHGRTDGRRDGGGLSTVGWAADDCETVCLKGLLLIPTRGESACY